MKTITILSGKGGTGKSSVTASLAVLLGKRKKIVGADCDVDAPNLGLVLGLREFDSCEKIQTSEKAKLLEERCTGCRKCLEICNFGAISWNKEKNKPVFNKLVCEGCGACQIVCPNNAIKLEKVNNAEICVGKTKYGFYVVSGQLKMGESGSGKIVYKVKEKAREIAKNEKAEFMLIDSSAGIGCPVIASVQGSDFVIAVTEPSPSALNDLKRSLQVVEHFGIPCGIIINKFDLNEKFTGKIQEFAEKQKIQILGKIPYDRKFVEALVKLKPVVVYDKKFEKIFVEILENII